MLFKLAWRNLWRNKKRTMITASSIFFAVLFSVFMISIQYGGWGRMIDNVINYWVGYGQIHKKGYWDEPTINNSFEYTEALKLKANNINNLENLIPRLESFALAAHKNITKGILLAGIDPVMENEMTKLKERLIDGDYLKINDKSVLVAEDLCKQLKLKLNDTLIMISQGYHGVNAAGKYPISGIIHFSNPDLNKKMVYLPLPEAQYFFGAENQITTLAMHIKHKDHLNSIMHELSTSIDNEKYELIDWEQLVPGLLEAMKTKLAGVYIFMLILYTIITFGIFGTILMMIKEREYEFGILISIGMKHKLIAIIVWIETVLIGFVGSLMGIAGSIPLVYYFKINPIDMSKAGEEVMEIYAEYGIEPIFPTAFEWPIFYNQAIIVFILTSFTAMLAIWKVMKLKPLDAMKG